MQWYDYLYVGEKAGAKRYGMIRKIRGRKLQRGGYVITPASNGNNILDIYPSAVLLLPYYKDKNLLILGIAADYWEALGLARDIVDDLYSITGGFDLKKFLTERNYKV